MGGESDGAQTGSKPPDSPPARLLRSLPPILAHLRGKSGLPLPLFEAVVRNRGILSGLSEHEADLARALVAGTSPLTEAKKRIVGNLCVNTGQGSGGGFTACNAGGGVDPIDPPRPRSLMSHEFGAATFTGAVLIPGKRVETDVEGDDSLPVILYKGKEYAQIDPEVMDDYASFIQANPGILEANLAFHDARVLPGASGSDPLYQLKGGDFLEIYSYKSGLSFEFRSAADFVNGLSADDIEAAYYPDLEDQFNREFWESPQPLFHASKSENIDSILKNGLEAANASRGLSNRNVGAAVFTTQDHEGLLLGSYGGAIFTIDTQAMKRDGLMLRVSEEPGNFEGRMKGALVHALDLDPGLAFVEDDGLFSDTVIVHGSIPAKYVALYRRMDEVLRRVLDEAKKRIVGNLCVNAGEGSGGGFTACNTGTGLATEEVDLFPSLKLSSLDPEDRISSITSKSRTDSIYNEIARNISEKGRMFFDSVQRTELDAVNGYVATDYPVIQHIARGDPLPPALDLYAKEEMSMTPEESFQALKSVVDRAPILDDVVTYRGDRMRDSYKKAIEEFENGNEVEIQTNVFASSSFAPEVAAEFAHNKSSAERVVFRQIGGRGAPIGMLLERKGLANSDFEREILYGPGQVFRVAGVHKNIAFMMPWGSQTRPMTVIDLVGVN